MFAKNSLQPLVVLLALLISTTSLAAELTVYSSRNASYLKPLFDQYSRETSTAVSYLIAAPQTLIRKMQREGASNNADLLLLTGAENLVDAASKGVLATVSSRTLSRNVPAHLRSPTDQWFALSKRARAVVYNGKKVRAQELKSYQELADPKWKQRLCLVTSASDYTEALVAFLLQRQGEQATLAMLKGWVNNLAVRPARTDASLIQQMERGLCDVGLINSYYYARVRREDRRTPLKLFWPDQSGDGVSINITGAGVSTHAPHPHQALDLLEWLTTKRPQTNYARLSMEYPVNHEVYPPREIGRLGRFKEDRQSLANVAVYRAKARELIQLANYR